MLSCQALIALALPPRIPQSILAMGLTVTEKFGYSASDRHIINEMTYLVQPAVDMFPSNVGLNLTVL